MRNEPTDAMLDDPLYRHDIIDEERRTWLDETDDDDARADEADDFNDD